MEPPGVIMGTDPSYPARRRRVLVVDNDPDVRECIQLILSSKGYEVICAADGIECLEIFSRERNLDVALIDLNMPRMDGIELIRSIRKLDGRIALFLITTYFPTKGTEGMDRQLGFDCIFKPFTIREVVAKMDRVLGASLNDCRQTPPAGACTCADGAS